MTPSRIICFTCWSPEVAARSGSRYKKKYGSDISSCKHQPISPVAVRGGHLPITLTASPATVGNWGRATLSINKKRKAMVKEFKRAVGGDLSPLVATLVVF